MSISIERLDVTAIQSLAGQELDFSLTPNEAKGYCRLFFRDTIGLDISYVRTILNSFYNGNKPSILGYGEEGSLNRLRILISPEFLDLINKLDSADRQKFLIKVLFWLETITHHPPAIDPKAVLRKHGRQHRVRGPKKHWFKDYLIRRHDKE